jgi:hypothetical protein
MTDMATNTLAPGWYVAIRTVDETVAIVAAGAGPLAAGSADAPSPESVDAHLAAHGLTVWPGNDVRSTSSGRRLGSSVHAVRVG